MPKRRTPVALPEPGAAFLMPLADGRFGVCRVLRRSRAEDEAFVGAPHVVAAASPWIGHEAPDLNDPQLRQILTLTHHAWDDRAEILWLAEPVPEAFVLLGLLPPSDADQAIECWASSAWVSFPLQVLLQWRWDHDREALLAEEAVLAVERQRAGAAAAAQQQERLARLTLRGLRNKRRFTGWKGYVDDRLIRECRAIFRETCDALILLGPTPTKRAVLKALQPCIVKLNTLDDANGHFIDTIAREDLCEAFDEIVYAAGVPSLRDEEDVAGRWRDW